MSDLASDLRYGARLLRRAPGFTVVAVASLALGIAGATTVFTLLNAIVLRPLPVANPGQLYVLRSETRRDHDELFSAPVFDRARAAVGPDAELCAATGVTAMQLWPDGQASADRGAVQLVSGEYFSVLRQRPELGRLLGPSDNLNVDAHPVVVVSDAFWRQHLAASPAAVGGTLRVNGVAFTIVGVAEPGFFGTTVAVRNPDAWIPFRMQSAVRYNANSSNSNGDSTKPWSPQPQITWLNVFARIPGTSAAPVVASKVSAVVQQDALEQLPASPSDDARRNAAASRATLDPAPGGLSSLRDKTTRSLVVLLAMVGVLLAIACGNVAGLLLARAAGREREVSIRLSIGAKRMRLVRQMLAESLLLGAGAGALGLGLAVWLHDPFLRMVVPGATAVDLQTGLDWRVMLFAALVSLGTGVACGLVPALRGTRVALTDSLKQHSRGTVGPGGRRTLFAGRMLVAAQMAFCLLLLVVAGLFARSLQSLARTDVGFDRDHVLVASVDVRGAGIPVDRRIAVYRRLIERLDRIPGVVSASMSANGPLNNSSWRSSMNVEGYVKAPQERLVTNEELVEGPYFQTVGLRLLQGRLFEPQDLRPDSRATIVNETMAKRFFPGQSAIGKRWTYGGDIGPDAFTIVGVVEDAKYLQIRAASPLMAYHPAEFTTEEVAGDIEVRTEGAPPALLQTVRQAIREVAPDLPLTEVVPLEARVERNVSQDRLVAQLSSAFGALALLLACLGLYGTISYGISRRTGELGLRMALGADRSMVLRMVMVDALKLVAVGGILGVPLALLTARSLGALLYGIPPADLVSYAGAALVLAAVASLAAFVPARRASRIAPMVALNS